ncbi:MAG: hypothetical protein JO235_23230 [Chroococcidiopsidaceae cyanobacterium CP_BM_RX_35]|nr:hypothetical protein [Chroococcidiopsidaceae cyanobacterium CP_BM_RX_35]
MTQLPPDDSETLLQSLRQKQGNWVEWGKACQQLQKSGYSPQAIFEATGFEPIQQNQIIVGSQVYASLEQAGVSEAVRSHYNHKGSDILYEFRLLTQPERAAAAELVVQHQLNADDAREVARAIKEFEYLRTLPAGFSNHPGDAVAYQCWKLARQKTELQDRSRLIAKGLRFAHTQSARQQIEQLLVDFTVEPKRPAPKLPIYRMESEEELPRLVPVVGQMPLKATDLQAVPLVEEIEPFSLVKFAGEQAWVPLPGWQVVSSAEDPVAILCDSDRLPNQTTSTPETVLVVIDRSRRQWDVDSYFVVDQSGQLEFQWFETETAQLLLGRVIIVVRPKRVLDEELAKDAWQIDE